MADPVRLALLALSFGAVLVSSLAWVSPLRLGGTASLLAIWVVGAGQLILLAQGLSLLHGLDWPGFLIGHLLTVSCTAVWVLRRPPADRWLACREIRAGVQRLGPLAWDWRAPALPILAGATLLTGLTGTVVALWVPPNNLDSLSYHMSRVGYYLQFRSLDHYPTLNLQQVVHPANAEILILWTVAFLRVDHLANTVQLAAWAFTAVAVFGLGRQVGFGRRAALFGAGAFALLPQPVLQSTTAHNDLVVASFLATGLLFLLGATRAPRPIAQLTLAGAAIGLALGTKGTALLALPGLAGVFLLLFRWLPRPGRRSANAGSSRVGCEPWRPRSERQVVAGLLAGSLAAILLGCYVYVQNWYLYGSPFGSPLLSRVAAVSFPIMSREGFVANLARTLFTFAFADFSGPLGDPRVAPLTVHLVEAVAAVGAWLFATLAIPTVVGGIDADPGMFPPFRFARMPIVDDYVSGVGPIGGLIVALAGATLIWPGRMPAGRRLLALAALSYVLMMALTLSWSPFGAGRYLVSACALGAPLLGLVGPRQGRLGQTLALALALWSGATGLYVAWFNHYKPVSGLAGQDRLGLTFPAQPTLQAFFREVDQEVGPVATVGVYGDVRAFGVAHFPEYPFFGARFTRTLVPLVDPDYAERTGLRRALSWSNQSLLTAYRPTYLVVQSRRSGPDELPDLIPGRCMEVPLRHGKPTVPWELWRCADRDPARPQGQ